MELLINRWDLVYAKLVQLHINKHMEHIISLNAIKNISLYATYVHTTAKHNT